MDPPNHGCYRRGEKEGKENGQAGLQVGLGLLGNREQHGGSRDRDPDRQQVAQGHSDSTELW